MQSGGLITEHVCGLISCSPKVPARGLTSGHGEASRGRSEDPSPACGPVSRADTPSAQVSRSVRLFSGHPSPASSLLNFPPWHSSPAPHPRSLASLLSVCLPHWNERPGEHRFLSFWLAMVNTPELSTEASESRALRRQPPEGGREGRREDSTVKMK